MALPAYQAPNALNFEPIQQGFNAISQNALARNQQGMEQQRLGMEQATNQSQLKSAALQQQQEQIQLHGRIAAGIAALDPADQPAAAAAYLKQYPEMAQHIQNNGYDINNVPSWTKAIVAEGVGPQNPLDVQSKKLGIEQAQQNLDTGKWTDVEMGVDPLTFQPRKGKINLVTGEGFYFNPDGSQVRFKQGANGQPSPSAPGAAPNVGGQPQQPTNGIQGMFPSATDKDGKQLSVDDYTKNIPDPNMRGRVAAVLRGEDSLPNIGTRSGQTYQQMVGRYVYGYDPTFNPTEAANRKHVETDLADTKNGHLGSMSASVGKMAGHFNELADAAKDVKTTPILLWNKATQTFETQKGSPQVPRFMSAANTYMHELAKVLKGGTGVPTDADMEGLASFFNSAQSPEQLKSVLQTWDHQAHATIDSMDSTTQRAIGDKYWNPDKHSVITPYAKKQFERADKNSWLHPHAPGWGYVGPVK